MNGEKEEEAAVADRNANHKQGKKGGRMDGEEKDRRTFWELDRRQRQRDGKKREWERMEMAH